MPSVSGDDDGGVDAWVNGSDCENGDSDLGDVDHEQGQDGPSSTSSIPPAFFSWHEVFPFLSSLLQRLPAIAAEAATLERNLRFTPWPESNLYSRKDQNGDWKVVPLLYTFPATDASSSKWVGPNCDQCPMTTSLLKSVPGIRTALFSRMGPRTKLSAHRGWADLANYVLRCHLPLKVPETPVNCCGVWVEGHVKNHKVGDIIVFDDSRTHKAFNASPDQDRVVLIFDIIRPSHIPLGLAEAGHTEALDSFIDDFEETMSRFAT